MADTAPLRLVSSMATRALLADLVAGWHASGGRPVEVTSIGGVDAARRVADGEPFDVVVLASDAIAKLVAAGHAHAGPADVVRSAVAVAVPEGRPAPAVDTEAALRAAVEAAPRIALSTGPSGVALQAVFERWGLTDTLRERFVQAPPGVPVARLLARGDADLGFQQLSELIDEPGIHLLGALPRGLEIVTTFTAARCTRGRLLPDAAALIVHLCAPAADDLKRRHGMMPAPAHVTG